MGATKNELIDREDALRRSQDEDGSGEVEPEPDDLEKELFSENYKK